MNLLQQQNAARAAWNVARTICAAPAWDTLDSTARADWYARFDKELNAGAIAAQDAPQPETPAPDLPRDVLALTTDSLAYFAQRVIEGQDIAESWEDATNALPMPPAIAALANAQATPTPMLTSPALDDVCESVIDYNGKGVPHIMGITAPLVAIHRGKSYDDSERLTIAKDVARAARELATALETAH